MAKLNQMDHLVEHLELGMSQVMLVHFVLNWNLCYHSVPCIQIGGEVGMAEQEVKEIHILMETVAEMNFHCAKEIVMLM